jgi:predicted PurR-regulated permease PerM
MASRHHKPGHGVSRANALAATIAFVVAFAAIVAAVAVHAVDGAPTAAREAPGPAPAGQQPLRQQGRLVAVSPTSVTAESVDGFARTYVITSETNAITAAGSRIGGAATTFAVNDVVSIVGVLRDGTAVATAVADQRVSNLDGPPMDGL